MKRKELIGGVIAILMASMIISPMHLNAQDEEKSSPFDVGGDLVSSYLWRGTKFGTGPAIQPHLSFAVGGFEIGGWGSYCFTSNEGAEADLYASYGFDFGLSFGVTDYYYPGTEYFDYSPETGSHAIEINLGYEIKGFSLGANYILNEAGSAGSQGSDMYFELGYGFKYFGLHVGGGDGWHTADGEFNVCNIGLTASKEISITDKFSLPVSGALIWNPDKEQFHVVVGVSF
ncbi:MAG: TorF family putative porin [Bacteroidales bacterium]